LSYHPPVLGANTTAVQMAAPVRKLLDQPSYSHNILNRPISIYCVVPMGSLHEMKPQMGRCVYQTKLCPPNWISVRYGTC